MYSSQLKRLKVRALIILRFMRANSRQLKLRGSLSPYGYCLMPHGIINKHKSV